MSRSVETVVNEANPSKVDSGLQQLKVGTSFRENGVHTFNGAVASDVLVLPNNAKAAQALDGYAKAGTATGRLTVAAKESTPGAGTFAVTPSGDLEFNSVDAVTSAIGTYVPMEGDLITEVVVVDAAGAASFLQNKEGALLISGELLDGSSPGAKTVVARGGTPGVGEVALTDVGQLAFNGTDVGASPVTASVTYIAVPGVGLGVSEGLLGRLDSQIGT